MKVARWILGVAGAVVLLAVAAALVAMLLVNPDRYRGEIESAVRAETGRPFVIQGHLQIAWFPWLGVRTGAARLGNPPGAVGPDLLDWQSAQLRVRVLPLLLHHQLEVGRIRIVGADIHLRRRPRGEGSWDDLIARLHTGSGAKGTPATWAGLDIENGSLDYVDERSLERTSLAGWRLSAGPWRAAEPLAVSTSFVLHVDTLGVHGTAVAESAGSRAGAFVLPAAGVPVSIDVPRLQIETSAARPLEVIAPRWSLHVADAKLGGDIDASRDVAGHVTAGGALTAAVPSLRGLARTLGIGMPEVEDPAVLGALQLSGTWSCRDGALAVEPLTAKLDSTTITGRVAYGKAWTFALRADQVDFGRYLTHPKAQKPLDLPVSALRALRAQGTLELESARIDGTTLKDVRLLVQ